MKRFNHVNPLFFGLDVSAPFTVACVLFPGPVVAGIAFVARQPWKAWHGENGEGCRTIYLPFQHPQDGQTQDLSVSIPLSMDDTAKELPPPSKTTSIPDSIDATLEAFLLRKEIRWIFTPSSNRSHHDLRQALLDRSGSLPQPTTGLDVGHR